MNLAIHLTDTLYFNPQGSSPAFLFHHALCFLHYLCVLYCEAVHDTIPAFPSETLFMSEKFPRRLTSIETPKTHLCWFIPDLSSKAGNFNWCFTGSVALCAGSYSTTVIFHCGQTWTQSLTTALGIWRNFSQGCFSLLHQSCVHWFGFMCDPKLLTSASM